MDNIMDKTNQNIIFLHIPKTAGTTFREIICRQYESYATAKFYPMGKYPHKEFKEFKKDIEKQMRDIKCLIGHICMGWRCHELFPPPSTYITFLRDPVDKVISLYYFILKRPDHLLHNILKSKKMGLAEFVSSGMTSEIDNGQTRALACNGANLEEAKNNIREKFIIVGFTERFDETLILLKKIFGWENLFYMRGNVNKNRPGKEDTPKEVFDIIRNNNELDIKLYKFAKERFEELVRKQGPSFQEDLKMFKQQNTVWQEQQAIINEKLQIINKRNQTIENLRQNINKKDIIIRDKEKVVNALQNSRSWKITKPMRTARKLFHK